MTFEEYEPRSTLVVPAHPKTRAKFPFIDVHGHQPLSPSPAALDQLIREMDELNMRVMVNLSGRQGDALAGGVRTYARYPGRGVIFANLNFAGLDEPGWGDRAAAQLERDVKESGAVGLKLFKPLGMDLKDGTGRRVSTDDARLDPVWKKAGDLGIPVLIHTAEPLAFFTPIDKYNVRWLELTQFPGRARSPRSNTRPSIPSSPSSTACSGSTGTPGSSPRTSTGWAKNALKVILGIPKAGFPQ